MRVHELTHVRTSWLHRDKRVLHFRGNHANRCSERKGTEDEVKELKIIIIK